MPETSDKIIPSPHDSNKEISHEDLQEALQDRKFQRMMDKVQHQDPTKFFLHLATQGVKLPDDFDITTLKETKEERTHEDSTREERTFGTDKGKKTTNSTTPLDMLTKQVQTLQQQLVDLQTRTSTKHYSLEEISSYPFNKSLNMIPFPLRFEVLKFNKYRGKGDLRDHIREFIATCLDVAHNETFLMRLFPRSIGGKAMECFS